MALGRSGRNHRVPDGLGGPKGARDFNMAVSLKDEKLLDSWGVVMESGAGKQDSTILYIIQRLHGSEAARSGMEKR